MARSDPKDSLDYIRWYWRDWRSSTAFLSMTPLARGIYRELCDAHYGERDCSLPADDRALALLAGVPPDVWASVKAEVMPYLKPVSLPPGTPRVRNSRTYSEWKAAKEARRNKREAGRLGGKQKASNARATLQQNPSNALAVSAPSPSPSPSPLRSVSESAPSPKEEPSSQTRKDCAAKRRADTPQKVLARELAKRIGSGVKPCEDQVRALKTSGWDDTRIGAAIEEHAAPGISPWEWTRRVSGTGGGAKGMSAADILRWGAQA